MTDLIDDSVFIHHDILSPIDPSNPMANVTVVIVPAITSCAERFAKISPLILRHEGGYVNHPADHGGTTNRGVTIATFQSYAQSDLGISPTLQNLQHLTDAQATIIYQKRYWEPKGYCLLRDEKVALMVYDWSITSGRAGLKIRELLASHYHQNVSTRGGITAELMASLNSIPNQSDLLQRIGNIRKDYYRSIVANDSTQAVFLNGWLNRVNDCLNVEV